MRRPNRFLIVALGAVILLSGSIASCGGDETGSNRDTRNTTLPDSAFGFNAMRGGTHVYAGRRMLSCFDTTHCAAIFNVENADSSITATAFFGSGTSWNAATGGNFYGAGIGNFATTMNCTSAEQCVVMGSHQALNGPAGEQTMGWHGFISPTGATMASKSKTIVPPVNSAYNDSMVIHDSRCFSNGKCIGFGKYHPASAVQGFDKRYMDQATPVVVDGTKDAMTGRMVNFAVAGMRYVTQRLECASQNFCVAVGEYEEQDGSRPRAFVVPYINGVWSSNATTIPYPSDANSFPFMRHNDVSCAPNGSCYVVGNYKSTAQYQPTNQYWVEVKPTGVLGPVGKFNVSNVEPYLISCAAAGSCVAMNGASEFVMTNNTWSSSPTPLASTKTPDWRNSPPQLVCPTTTTCIFAYENLMNFRGQNGWLGWAQIPMSKQVVDAKLTNSFTLLSVVCPATNSCTILGDVSSQRNSTADNHYVSIATVSLARGSTDTSSPPSTQAGTTAPQSSVVPNDPTSGSKGSANPLVVVAKSTHRFAAIASIAGLVVPKGSTVRVVVAKSSATVCSVKKTSVTFSRRGNCKVTVSVKPKTGSTKSKTLTFSVK